MLKEVQNQINQCLFKGKACTINYFCEKFSCFNPIEILDIFVSIFKRDKNEKFDLFCHIVVANDESMRMQYERYSNIQRGVMIQNNNHCTIHQFKKEHIKQMKVLAIFPKEMMNMEVQAQLQMPNLSKTKEYVNKFVLVPKLSVQNTALVKNKSKKEEKKQEKPAEVKKSQQPVVEEKKALKKTQSKSSIQVEQKPSVPIAPLKKVSSRDQPVVSTPVLTNYAVQRKKVEQEVEVKPPQSKKLNLDSDEDYYIPGNASILNQQLKTNAEINNQTDHSAKKTQNEQEKMDIQSQNQKAKKFIVDDDQEEDDDFAKQIAAERKKETQVEIHSTSTQPKRQSSIMPPASKPKVEAPKAAPSVKPPNPSLASNKPAANLMNWLKPKKV